MRDLPLVALRAFAAVYQSGGVRSAARDLQITHSSVSRHLRELEAWLGAALFEPRKGKLAFTPNGEALGKSALTGLAELARAVQSVRELRRGNSVAIAATASFASRWLLPRLPALLADHPWIEVSVITESAVCSLADQRADLAVRMGVGPWTTDQCEPIMDDALYPVASCEYWRSLGERMPARAIVKARLLHDRDPASTWEKWFALHPAPGLDLRAGPRFTSSDLVLQAAARGLGIALARDRFAAGEVAAGSLIRPFGNICIQVRRAYWLVRPDLRPPRPAEEATALWLKAQACAAKTRRA